MADVIDFPERLTEIQGLKESVERHLHRQGTHDEGVIEEILTEFEKVHLSFDHRFKFSFSIDGQIGLTDEQVEAVKEIYELAAGSMAKRFQEVHASLLIRVLLPLHSRAVTAEKALEKYQKGPDFG